jgi:peroxiredoxin Q/BCP
MRVCVVERLDWVLWLGRPRSETAGSNCHAAVRDAPGSVGVDYDPRMSEPGDAAPDFELPDQDGHPVKLSDLRGKPVVVYFYPKAATPGCTVQACGVRDHRADYEQAGAVVLGISPDPVAKVKKFHEKEGLNFSLLADEGHAVAEAYGVWVKKSMYGREYLGNERTTFIVGADGKVAEVLHKVKPAEHDELVLKALAKAAPPVV